MMAMGKDRRKGAAVQAMRLPGPLCILDVPLPPPSHPSLLCYLYVISWALSGAPPPAPRGRPPYPLFLCRGQYCWPSSCALWRWMPSGHPASSCALSNPPYSWVGVYLTCLFPTPGFYSRPPGRPAAPPPSRRPLSKIEVIMKGSVYGNYDRSRA